MRLHLHGPLKRLCPEVIEIAANTVAEAINGLCKIKKGLFKPNLAENTRPVVRVVGFETVESLYEKTDVQDIHIVPALIGGKSGFFQIIIGAVLIAASFIIPGLQFLLPIGISMVIGGVTQLLFPVKMADQALDENKYLGAPQNTVKIGTRIPLLFGTCRGYGHYLSYNVDAIEVA
jgi:predicted phage tail protein